MHAPIYPGEWKKGTPANTYLEVISNVVPKIWARTNSAIFADRHRQTDRLRLKTPGAENVK
jgi:hypothetical protein